MNDLTAGPRPMIWRVQVNYKDGKEGVYNCTKRPYFNYENDSMMIHLEDESTMVVNMRECKSVIY